MKTDSCQERIVIFNLPVPCVSVTLSKLQRSAQWLWRSLSQLFCVHWREQALGVSSMTFGRRVHMVTHFVFAQCSPPIAVQSSDMKAETKCHLCHDSFYWWVSICRFSRVTHMLLRTEYWRIILNFINGKGHCLAGWTWAFGCLGKVAYRHNIGQNQTFISQKFQHIFERTAVKWLDIKLKLDVWIWLSKNM